MLRISSLGVWAAWITATAISGSLALILSAAFVHVVLTDIYFSSSAGLTGDNLVPHYLVWAVRILLFVGPLIGISQGLVLRVFVHYREWLSWTIHSLLGISIAMIVLVLISMGVGAIIGIFVVPGFIYGLAQWLILRRSTKQANWWIVISGVGWMFALALGLVLTGVLLPSNWKGLPFYLVESVIYLSLACFITLVIFAGITGAVLLNPLERESTGN